MCRVGSCTKLDNVLFMLAEVCYMRVCHSGITRHSIYICGCVVGPWGLLYSRLRCDAPPNDHVVKVVVPLHRVATVRLRHPLA